MRAVLVLLPIVCACSGPKKDVYFANIGDNLADLVIGKDRGLWSYRATIHKNISSIAGPYKYVPPKPWIAQYKVIRASYGLGGTKVENAEQLAQVVDTLFHVLRNDPTAATRSTACLQLGRVLLRLPVDTNDALPPDPGAEEKINALATDLWDIKVKLDKGQKVKEKDALALMQQLADTPVPRMRSAIQVVRACSLPPIALVSKGKVWDYREKIVPRIVRDAILVALREVAVGNPPTRDEPDASEQVRADAIDVLTRVASPVALHAGYRRIADDIDPLEGDEEVRRKLVQYMGVIGGPEAFAACVTRLNDVEDVSVRYHAHAALLKMTGARVTFERGAWRAWREKHPEWQLEEADKAKSR